MPNYNIKVWQTKYKEYPLFTFYDIEAPNYHDAEKKARKQFVAEWGFEYQETSAYTPDKYQIEYRHSLIEAAKK